MKRLALILIIILLSAQVFAFRFEYNKTIDTLGDVGMYLSIALPASLLLEAPKEDYLSLALSYGSTLSASYLTRTLLKDIIDKDRPYVGYPDAPPHRDDDNKSFPSGHAIMSFASAAYSQSSVIFLYPDSTFLKSIALANWALALTTSTLRIVGGSHHVEDVLVGAAIGTGFGFLGPFVTHQLQKRDKNAPQVLIGQATGVRISY